MNRRNVCNVFVKWLLLAFAGPALAGALVIKTPAQPSAASTESAASSPVAANKQENKSQSATSADANTASKNTAPKNTAASWTIDVRDVTLSNTFTRWAVVAGQRVRWDVDKHVLVEAPDTITGSFEDAVTAVLSSPGITQGPLPLEVCFYPNTPQLARITRKGEQNKECK